MGSVAMDRLLLEVIVASGQSTSSLFAKDLYIILRSRLPCGVADVGEDGALSSSRLDAADLHQSR
jgi:hypothetical protein